MRKLLASGILLALCCATSFASIHVGARGGLNLTKVSIDWDFDRLKSEIKPGILLGGIAEVPILSQRIVSARVELLYVQKGWVYKYVYIDASGNDLGEMYHHETSHRVVGVGLLIARLPMDAISPYAVLGAEVEYELSRRYRNARFRRPSSGEYDVQNDTNLGVNVGVGCAFALSKSEFQVELRLNQGMLGWIFSHSSVNDGRRGGLRTSCVQLTAAYLFPLDLK